MLNNFGKSYIKMTNTFYLKLIRSFILTLVVGGLIFLLAYHRPINVSLPELDSYRCMVAQAHNSSEFEVFRLVVPDQGKATKYADYLCEHVLPGSRFSAAEISWLSRYKQHAHRFGGENTHLIFIRREHFKALNPGFDQFYQSIFKPPAYSAYWFSHHEGLELSQAFFEQKRIGLYEDKYSLSSYQMPLQQLQANNIVLNESQITYYSTRYDLAKAFLNNELDLMAGMRFMDGLGEWPQLKSYLISDHLVLGELFVHRSVDPALHCRLNESMVVYKSLMEHMTQKPMPMARCKP